MDSVRRSRIVESLLLVARAELNPSQRAMLGARLTKAKTHIQQIDAIVRSLKAVVR